MENGSFDNTIFGVLDRINGGIKTYFDARIAINESQARLALSEHQKESARNLGAINDGYATGVDWGVSEDNESIYDSVINIDPQLAIAIVGLALVTYVVVRS